MKKTSILLAILVSIPLGVYAQSNAAKGVMKGVTSSAIKETTIKAAVTKAAAESTAKTAAKSVTKSATGAATKSATEAATKAATGTAARTIAQTATDAAAKTTGLTIEKQATTRKTLFEMQQEAPLRPSTPLTEKVKSNALENGKITKEQVSPWAGSYNTRSIVEYASPQSEEEGIFAISDNVRSDVGGIYNWEKKGQRIDPEEEIPFKPLQSSQETISEAQQAIQDNIPPEDAIPNRPMYETPYPSGNERAIYKAAYSEISEPISSADVIKTGMDVSPQTKEEFMSLFNKMQELNYQMASQIQKILRAELVEDWEKQKIFRDILEVEKEMDVLQAKLFTPSSAIIQTRFNIEAYTKALVGKPAKRLTWTNPVDYKFSSFSLPYSISSGTFTPSEFQLSEVVGTPKERQIIEQIQQQLPPDLRIAILNDDHMVPDAFKAARTLPKGESAGLGASQTLNYFPEGFKIEHFNNVQDFLAAHRQEQFDLIFTDWIFPGGGGDMVRIELRSAGDETPLIFNSKGNMSPVAVQKLYKEGYSAHLPVLEEFEPTTALLSVRDYVLNAQAGNLMPLLRFKAK